MLKQLVFLAVVGLSLGAPSSKIDEALKNLKSSATIAIRFTQSTDSILKSINSMKFSTRGAKIFTMKSQLEQLTASSQQNVIGLLQSRQISFKSFWINNHLYVRDASAELINEIAQFPEVVEVREQDSYFLLEDDVREVDANPIPEDLWNIDRIETEQAWNLPGGNNGSNVVVGVISTGALSTHVALRNNFRKENGWHNAVHDEEHPPDEVFDKNGHGTHLLGTIVGDFGIGIAPGASWIICKAINDYRMGTGEIELVECAEWLVCPNGHCDQAADVVCNSWAKIKVGGKPVADGFYAAIEAWHAAGITPVAAIGQTVRTFNTIDYCTTTYAPGNWDNVIGVGATEGSDKISAYSTMGPTRDGRLKPDISAPGSSIRSAGQLADNFYTRRSGTTMAAAHVTAVVALLKSRNPNLTFTQIKDLLQNNADRNLVSVSDQCGGIQSHEFPNNVYGHGRLNARASLAAAIAQH